MEPAREDYTDIAALAEKIPPEEPVFILRAQDHYAAETVRFYAALLANEGEQQIANSAWEQAQRMDDWAFKKCPDLPETHLDK